MSLTSYEETGRVGRVWRGCYEDATRKRVQWNFSLTQVEKMYINDMKQDSKEVPEKKYMYKTAIHWIQFATISDYTIENLKIYFSNAMVILK